MYKPVNILDEKTIYTNLDDKKFPKFHELDEETKDVTLEWIRCNLWPVKATNKNSSTYTMKHLLQSQTGVYLTENEFAEALLLCGFTVKSNGKRKYFNFSKRSPACYRQTHKICFASEEKHKHFSELFKKAQKEMHLID